MLEYLLIGSGFAFAAAVQPGPLQAFLLSRVAERGAKATLPAAFSPLVSDGPIAILSLLMLRELPRNWARALQGAGGLLLLYFAFTTWRAWRRASATAAVAPQSQPGTILEAAMVNALNPNPYLGWTLVLGPLVLQAWAKSAAAAVGLVASFYVTMVVMLAATILLFGSTRFLGPRGRRHLILASAIVLALLGVWQLVSASGLTGR